MRPGRCRPVGRRTGGAADVAVGRLISSICLSRVLVRRVRPVGRRRQPGALPVPSFPSRTLPVRARRVDAHGRDSVPVRRGFVTGEVPPASSNPLSARLRALGGERGASGASRAGKVAGVSPCLVAPADNAALPSRPSRSLPGGGGRPGNRFRLRGRPGVPWGAVRGPAVPVVRPGRSVP